MAECEHCDHCRTKKQELETHGDRSAAFESAHNFLKNLGYSQSFEQTLGFALWLRGSPMGVSLLSGDEEDED